MVLIFNQYMREDVKTQRDINLQQWAAVELWLEIKT